MSVLEPGRTSGLRRTAARGMLINAAFYIGVTSLGLLKGFAVAGFLSPHDYGLWGLLIASLSAIGLLKQVGVVDRYVQQSEEDQELAFQQAFSVEVLFDVVFAVLLLGVVPLLAFAYGRTELLGPGFALVAVIPALALQSPLWIFYRRMEFGRQRRLGAVDPVVEFVVTIALAAAGLGYWSLIVGVLVGNYASAIAVVRSSPYKLAWRLRRSALHEYVSFSWPLFLASGSTLLVTEGAVIVGTTTLGLAGVGAIALAGSIVSYAAQVDQIVSEALYPAICRVHEHADLLFESFAKSNRLGLMWGAPLGVGVALFAGDLVHYGIGEHWRPAVGIIAVFGLIAAWDQIAYNWDDYFRARGETRPIAIVNGVATAVFLAVALPLLATNGLPGLEIGMAITSVANVGGRIFYITRLFATFDVLRHVLRAIAPTVPAALMVLAFRAGTAVHGLGIALGQLFLYVLIVVLATLLLERPLLRELAGYLSPRVAVPR